MLLSLSLFCYVRATVAVTVVIFVAVTVKVIVADTAAYNNVVIVVLFTFFLTSLQSPTGGRPSWPVTRGLGEASGGQRKGLFCQSQKQNHSMGRPKDARGSSPGNHQATVLFAQKYVGELL